MLHKILSAGLILFLASCMKIQKKGEEQKNENAVPLNRQTATVEKLDYTYDFSNSVQRVVFTIPRDWGTDVIVEKFYKEKVMFQRELSLVGQNWSDSLSEDSKVKYRFHSKQAESLSEDVEVIPALNLVVSEQINLSEKYELTSQVKKIYFQNLEIKSSGKLLIGDFKGEIIINKIQSDNGVLQTFAENQRADFEKDGRSVGGFNLLILEGSGFLKLNLFAEAGGDGKNGTGPDEKLTGSQGDEGAPANFEILPPETCFVFSNPICIPYILYNCITSPRDGGEGGQGEQGYSGTQAGHGGSVEKTDLVNHSNQLQVQIYKKAGQKGKGGLGGSGGRGGPGGLGGDGALRDFIRFNKLNPDDPHSIEKLFLQKLGKTCTPAKQGPTGIRGEAGNNGHDGVDGQVF